MKTATNQSVVVAMVMAMDKNSLIGKAGCMPWHIPGEQVYFKTVTMGKPIIMGRKTFDSIGKPLPGRPNLVVTRNPNWQADGVTVCESLEHAFGEATALVLNSEDTSPATDPPGDDKPEIMVIGGAALCREAMPQTDRLYLTTIDHEYEGDTWLDSFDFAEWKEVSRQDNEQDGLKYSYLVLERL